MAALTEVINAPIVPLLRQNRFDVHQWHVTMMHVKWKKECVDQRIDAKSVLILHKPIFNLQPFAKNPWEKAHYPSGIQHVCYCACGIQRAQLAQAGARTTHWLPATRGSMAHAPTIASPTAVFVGLSAPIQQTPAGRRTTSQRTRPVSTCCPYLSATFSSSCRAPERAARAASTPAITSAATAPAAAKTMPCAAAALTGPVTSLAFVMP
mmetsp:Transcript_36719/g.59874  ORF Transcript_36719/g.59874 Transcript_36719/m.59874 type:complete len:209 (+) Transcript_36719:399-1025(+)